jgi:hypothetical protein
MDAQIPGNLLTTAMAVMPHTDVDRALEMALSLDVPFWPQLPHYSYTNAEIFASYSASIRRFLDRGGTIVWGIVPTGFEAFEQEAIPSLIKRLEAVWEVLWAKGIDREQLIARSMLSPATCCLVNPDRERTVERAFAAVIRMAVLLRDKYQQWLRE